MQKKVLLGAVLSAILAFRFFPGLEGSQGGDQFLDGIGETALVARYVLGGNTEDSSRNNFHASLRGSGGAFVEDSTIRQGPRALGQRQPTSSFPVTPSPERTRSASRAGCTCRPAASGPFFDFGQSASARMFAGVTAAGFRASVVSGDARHETSAAGSTREPVDSRGRRARPGAPCPDDVSRRRPGGSGDGRRRDRGAADQPDVNGEANRLYSAAPRTRPRRRSKAGCATSASTASR